MRFIKSFFISALVACAVYYAAILMMIDAPVPAEYWVADLITVKKELVKKYSGKEKIIVAGGSSTLFGVDAEYASKQLGLPVINFGLHAGLRLEKILQETSAVVENGDILVLLLEPTYYKDHSKWTSWQVSNVVGWDHGVWGEMNYLERCKFISSVSPVLFSQMCIARIYEKFFPAAISERLAVFDSNLTLSKFQNRTKPAVFKYSAYNLDEKGDMLRTEGADFKGNGVDFNEPSCLNDKPARYLFDFVNGMKRKGVRVYFANTPYVASENSLPTLCKGEQSFLTDFTSIGSMIDRRQDLVFDRKYFFNTSLHLNAQGRSLRTDILVHAIRKNVLSETSE